MKLNGKKTLAWLLTIATIMSLCTFGAFAATVPVESVTIEGEESITIGVGEKVELTATVSPSNATKKTVSWSSNKTTIASVSKGVVTGKKAGTATITVKTTSGSKTDSVSVTVQPITSITMNDVTVGYGTSKSTVEAILNTQEIVKHYDGGFFDSKCDSSWDWDCDDYQKNVRDEYTFTLDHKDITGEVDVTVGDITLMDSADATLDPIYVAKGTKYSTSLLPSSVSLLLNNSTEKKSLTIGSKSSTYFAPWEGPITSTKEKFEETGTYNYTAAPKDKDNWDLPTLTQPVIVYDNTVADIDLDADTSYVLLEDAASAITSALANVFGSDAKLDHIAITKITGYNDEKDSQKDSYISGTLYTDSDCVKKVEESNEPYSAEALADMCFVANGKGYDTILEYTAYADEAGKQSLKGRIVIDSEQFMILKMEVSNSDVLDFTSSAFSSAYKSLDNDYTLDFVEFDNDLTSSEGELYYKYNSKKDKEVVTSEEYYVKADKDEDQWDLDDVTFVPDEDAKGLVTIAFDAYGYYDDDEDDVVDPVAGVIQINILDKASIEIFAGVEEKTPVDIELFKDYLDDEADTTKIAYIVFDGAPYTTTSGYLVSGDESFKSSGDKTFHMDPDSDEYDLEDLYFVGGSSKGTERADFEIYYYDDGEVEDDPVTGTVDFITGVSTNIYTNYPLKASTVLKFSENIDAFEKVGEQENEYFVFTSLPKGAKLYYNYGMSTQEDVTRSTEYYLGNVSGKKLLKNITFVPSYSATKQQQVISFDYKAYDENDDYVAGSCFIEVQYAKKSDFFPDITTSVYADSVDFLKNQKITEGVPGGKYDAAGSLTRAQVVTFLYRAAGSPTTYNNSTTTFKDIVKGEYYYNAVLWANKTGVTKGRDAFTFDPNATVTNAEVIQFMYNFDVNYLKHTSYTAGSISSITDYSQVGSWATTAVRWAIGKGVLTPGYLYPATVGTRGNIALYLHRMLTL